MARRRVIIHSVQNGVAELGRSAERSHAEARGDGRSEGGHIGRGCSKTQQKSCSSRAHKERRINETVYSVFHAQLFFCFQLQIEYKFTRSERRQSTLRQCRDGGDDHTRQTQAVHTKTECVQVKLFLSHEKGRNVNTADTRRKINTQLPRLSQKLHQHWKLCQGFRSMPLFLHSWNRQHHHEGDPQTNRRSETGCVRRSCICLQMRIHSTVVSKSKTLYIKIHTPKLGLCKQHHI